MGITLNSRIFLGSHRICSSWGIQSLIFTGNHLKSQIFLKFHGICSFSGIQALPIPDFYRNPLLIPKFSTDSTGFPWKNRQEKPSGFIPTCRDLSRIPTFSVPSGSSGDFWEQLQQSHQVSSRKIPGTLGILPIPIFPIFHPKSFHFPQVFIPKIAIFPFFPPWFPKEFPQEFSKHPWRVFFPLFSCISNSKNAPKFQDFPAFLEELGFEFPKSCRFQSQTIPIFHVLPPFFPKFPRFIPEFVGFLIIPEFFRGVGIWFPSLQAKGSRKNLGIFQ